MIISIHNVRRLDIGDIEIIHGKESGDFPILKIFCTEKNGAKHEFKFFVEPDCELVQRLGGYLIGKEKPKDEK